MKITAKSYAVLALAMGMAPIAGQGAKIEPFAADSLPPEFAPRVLYDAARIGRRVHEPTIIEGSPGTLVLALLDYAPIGGRVPADMDSGNTIRFMRSSDGGRTWSRPSGLNKGYTINPGFVRGEKGDLWLFFDRKNSDLQDDNALWYCHSTDDGATWDEARPIPSPSRVHILVHNGVRLKNGNLIIPYAYDRGPSPVQSANYDWVAGALLSTNAGRDWKSYGDIEIPNLSGQPNIKSFSAEPVIVQAPDGRLRMLLRTRSHFIYQATSEDGREWSDAHPTRFSNPDAKISAITLQDGNIVMIWNDTEVFDYGTKRFPLMASLSRDGGKTWPYTVTISDDRVPLHYPTLIEFKGEIKVLYGWNYQQIRMVSLKESDLLHHWTAINRRESWHLENGVASMRDDRPAPHPEAWSHEPYLSLVAHGAELYPWTDWTRLVSFLPAKPADFTVEAEFRWDGKPNGPIRSSIGIFMDYQDEDAWMTWECRPIAGTVGLEREERFGVTTSLTESWRAKKNWTQPCKIEPGAWSRVRLTQTRSGARWELRRSPDGPVIASDEVPASYGGHFLALGALNAKVSFRGLSLEPLAADRP